MKSGEHGAADDNGFETGLRSLRAVVVDTSNLILDPALDSYYLMDASVVALSNETDLLNQLLDRRSARAGRTRHAELAAMLPLLKSNIETVESDLRVASEFNAVLKAPLEDDRNRFERSGNALLDRLDRASAAEAGDAAVDDVDVAIRAALADSFTLYDTVVARLDDLLARRIAMTSRQRNRDVAVVVGLFLLGMAASIWIGARTIGSLHRVTAAVRQIGRGETPALLETSVDDEVGMLAAAVNEIRELRLPAPHALPALDHAVATESGDRTVLAQVREENLRLKLLVADMVLANHARADDADGEDGRAIVRAR
jgi:hypothetical protein